MVMIVNVEKINALLKLPVRNQPVSRVHAPREFDICTGSADADVAVLARRPPEQREEYAVDQVQ